MAEYDDERYLMGEDEPGDEVPRGRRPRLEPHRGTLILVLGILGLVVCPLTGPFAWMMGSEDIRKIDAGRMDPAGRDLTQAGRIIGIIVSVLMIIGVAIFALAMIVGLFAAGSSSTSYGG